MYSMTIINEMLDVRDGIRVAEQYVRIMTIDW